jgi:gamma-D-glutamyl-L-lysine dipeptidyl-peptidase
MPSAIAATALAPVLAGPSVRAEQVTQLVLGESVAILESRGEWSRVCSHVDGYSGWVHAGYLLAVEDGVAAEWRAKATGWSEGAVLRAGSERLPLPLRARVIIQDGMVGLPDGRQATVAGGRVNELSRVITDARGAAPERWSLEHFCGTPYQWGGVTPWGVDCSGLVQTTFAARGVALPRDSAQQVTCGDTVELERVHPGDLLFFRGDSGSNITHVAFAGEADTLVHATLACGSMLMESWLPGTRAAGLRERLVAVRRLEPR